MFKKCISVILAAFVLTTSLTMVAVNADAVAKAGIVLPFKQVAENNIVNLASTTRSDEQFGSVTEVTYGGQSDISSFYLEFDSAGINQNDYCYVSFYVRVLSDDTYTLPTTVLFRDQLGVNRGEKFKITATTDPTEWRRTGFILQAGHTKPLVNNRLYVETKAYDATAKYKVEFAAPVLMHFGAYASLSDAKAVIDEQITHGEIESLTVCNTPVDFTANPSEYTCDVPNVAPIEIVAAPYHAGARCDVIKSADGSGYTINSYAPGYNYLLGTADSSNAGKYQTYRILCDTYTFGGGTQFAFDRLVSASPSPSDTPGLSYTASTTSDSNFDTIYQKTVDGCTEETCTYLDFINPGKEVAVGDYYYITFYYRFVDDDNYNLPTRFFARDNIGTNQGFYGNIAITTEWTKAEYILPAGNSSSGFAICCTSKDDGNYKLQVAQPSCFWFGVVKEGATAALNKAKLREELDKHMLTELTIDDETIDLTEHSDGYSKSVSVLSTSPDVEATTYWGTDFTELSQSSVGEYVLTAYSPRYNKFDTSVENNALKTEYPISIDYTDSAWYNWEYSEDNGTHSVTFDMDTKTAKSFVIVLAAYGGENCNELFGVNVSEPYSDITGTNPMTITISNLQYTPTSLKLLLLDDMGNLCPLIPAKSVLNQIICE